MNDQSGRPERKMTTNIWWTLDNYHLKAESFSKANFSSWLLCFM